MTATATTTSTLLDRLNPQQRAVVTAPDGHTLVLAGAGTGKTTTLVHRVGWLIEQGVNPSSILLLTFTRQAAEEMLHRAARLLNQPTLVIPGGTFHGWAHGLLRRYGRSIGLPPNFTPLNDDDAQDMIGQLRGAHAGTYISHEQKKKAPSKATITRIISKARNLDVPIREVLVGEDQPLMDFLPLLDCIASEYDLLKRAQHLVDYDDLLILLRTLLQTHPSIREGLQHAYRYILVDEYQDTNGLQVDLIEALAGPQTHIMVVGDDCQSIYAFRGADVTQIRQFETRFHATRYKLEGNYRSTQGILTIANHVADQSDEALKKTLVTTKTNPRLPELLMTNTAWSQSYHVVEHIKHWIATGIPREQIAVLFRSSFHAYDLEIALSHAGIPFEKRGGLSIQDLAHVKDLLAYIRVLHNPADSVAWRRLLLMIPKIGAKACDTIMKDIQAAEFPIDRLSTHIKKYPGLSPMIQAFAHMRDVDQSPATQLSIALHLYKPFLECLHDHPTRRLQDLERLILLAHDMPDVPTFLADMTLNPQQEEAVRDHDRIVLSTIHSAKGLEWQAVVVLHACDGIFPSWRNINHDASIDEDLRLLYVAVTRAKEHLVLGVPRTLANPGAPEINASPSRFLSGLNEDVLPITHCA